MDSWLTSILAGLAIPGLSLPAVFIVALLSATLLPMGSEPVVFGIIKSNPDLFWPAILVATLGNTLGGVISYAMGRGAKAGIAKITHQDRPPIHLLWLQRWGAKSMFLSFLPIVGDPMCALAGWLKLPFWPCVAYMALGKFLRYLVMTLVLLTIPDASWQWLWQQLVTLFNFAG